MPSVMETPSLSWGMHEDHEPLAARNAGFPTGERRADWNVGVTVERFMENAHLRPVVSDFAPRICPSRTSARRHT